MLILKPFTGLWIMIKLNMINCVTLQCRIFSNMLGLRFKIFYEDKKSINDIKQLFIVVENVLIKIRDNLWTAKGLLN